jgi:thiamine biosynthesis lipoprotein
VDLAHEVLQGKGFASWMVEVGGEVRTVGRKPGGAPWIVGIEAPIPGIPYGSAIHRKVILQNAALATSGDYRNFIPSTRERWHHIIDPRTGRSPSHDLASVSILADTCTQADALATAAMVLGPEEGKALIEDLPGVEALFIRRLHDDSFATSFTEGFPFLDALEE